LPLWCRTQCVDVALIKAVRRETKRRSEHQTIKTITIAPDVGARYESTGIGWVASTYLFDVDPPVQSILDQPHRSFLIHISHHSLRSTRGEAQKLRSSNHHCRVIRSEVESDPRFDACVCKAQSRTSACLFRLIGTRRSMFADMLCGESVAEE
jgi:hypothetical protein